MVVYMTTTADTIGTDFAAKLVGLSRSHGLSDAIIEATTGYSIETLGSAPASERRTLVLGLKAANPYVAETDRLMRAAKRVDAKRRSIGHGGRCLDCGVVLNHLAVGGYCFDCQS